MPRPRIGAAIACASIAWMPRFPPLMTESVRLSRRVVAQLSCSRAEAERYIENGWVQVDGVVIEAPQFATSPDAVIVVRQGPAPKPVDAATFVLHRGAATAADGTRARLTDEARSAALADELRAANQGELPTPRPLLARHLRGLVEPLPLEIGASGLTLVSQDPGFLRFASERGPGLEQEYVVEVAGVAKHDLDECLAELSAAGQHEGRRVAACKVSLQSEMRLRFAFPGRGPRPGELRARLEAVGLELVWSRRLRIGRLSLAKLPEGKYRPLEATERL